MKKNRRIGSRFFIGLVYLFLYAPIAILLIFSFNSSKSRSVWSGFTLDWYAKVFSNSQIKDALRTTIILALLSSLIALVIGVLAALGISAMRRRGYVLTMGITNIPDALVHEIHALT